MTLEELEKKSILILGFGTEGQATLDTGRRRVEVNAGERAYARRGETPDSPRRFDAGYEQDEFSRWNDDREHREAWAADSRRYLPDEAARTRIAAAGQDRAHRDGYHNDRQVALILERVESILAAKGNAR